MTYGWTKTLCLGDSINARHSVGRAWVGCAKVHFLLAMNAVETGEAIAPVMFGIRRLLQVLAANAVETRRV